MVPSQTKGFHSRMRSRIERDEAAHPADASSAPNAIPQATDKRYGIFCVLSNQAVTAIRIAGVAKNPVARLSASSVRSDDNAALWFRLTTAAASIPHANSDQRLNAVSLIGNCANKAGLLNCIAKR